MAVRLFIILVFAGIAAMAANVSASTTTYPTPEEAALAGLIRVLGEGSTILGNCDEFPTEQWSWDICYRGGQVDGESYWLYGAASGIPDMGWWLGVKPVEGGWIPYDGGRCDLFYCRKTDPDGTVVFGYPDGDANGDDITDSLDALLVLQIVANDERPFSYSGNVDPAGGLSSNDALLILQYNAGLIGGLPGRSPWAPDFEDK